MCVCVCVCARARTRVAVRVEDGIAVGLISKQVDGGSVQGPRFR